MDNNEKLKKIMSEPKLWIESFVKIVDKEGKLVPFKLNNEQAELLEGIDKYSIILKSRQLGISSVSLALSLYYALTQSNVTCLLMSYSIDSATGIFDKLKQMESDLPEVIRVKMVNNNRKELKFVNGSRIIVATCGTKDVARGLTIKFCHLSEVAFMSENIDKQLLAIEQALIPSGKIILESTANGLNHFSEMWSKAERQESLYKGFFFSWVNDKRMFAKEYDMFSEIWIQRNGKLPTKEELSDIEKDLYEQGASIKQLVWKRLKVANSSEEQFQQEFPSNPIEAFVSSGSNIFCPVRIHKKISNIHNIKHIQKPRDFPSALSMYFGSSLFLWADVEKGKRYYIGVDCSEGIGKDSSCIEIVDSDGFQVGEFSSNKIKPYEFAQVVYELGIYFNYALLVIEKASSGNIVLEKLRNEYSYKNIYKSRVYDERGRKKKKIGWLTNAKTKPLMIGHFVELFETDEIFINSKELLGQMKTFIVKDNGKTEGAGHKHDDCVLAFAMALQGIKSGIWYV